ncbi:hypothetical protein R1flu_003078 [Riccia fluitans]|uniref:Leucine-rich repeat-containing N-terminal plant-type domain-containing protein n=1 Tax=Riccia fluitans TaxID=41844 RepID=A0ABD1Y7Y8_9MARC
MGVFKSLWAVTVLILSIYLSGCEAQECNANDKKALLKFKAGFISQAGWFWDTWDAGTSCCQWLGVNCTTSGRVQGLTINNPWSRHGPSSIAERDPTYEGAVGATLGDLSELRALELSEIMFNGPMPNTFGKMKKLEELKLFYNNFSGSLSPSIGGATSLKSLTVDGSGYTVTFPNISPASIPTTFCQLKNLRTLVLTSFRLNGKIPECLCKLGQLKDLDLNGNELKGGIPDCISSNLRKLESLILTSNRLVGEIPSSIGHLRSLISLNLNDNKFCGSIPKEIGNLVHLQNLGLANNSLSGPIPASLGNLVELNSLDLKFNSLTRIPPEVGKLARISTFVISNNQLQGKLPPEIGNCGNQGYGVYMEISNNKLLGSIPDVFGRGNINIFFAHHNQFTGGFPLSLAMVGDVDVSYNRLSDPKPVGTLPADPKIYYLRLSHNLFSGSPPSWLENLVTIAKPSNLEMFENKFTGPVPAYFFSGSNAFGNLNASHNWFTGPLPSITTATVSSIDLSHNRISGSVTSNFFGALLNTTYFMDLSFNRLTGPLPENSGDFQMIYYMDLSDNKLSGEVPDTIEKMPTLSYLDLSDNNFTGRVPSKKPSHPLLMSA